MKWRMISLVLFRSPSRASACSLVTGFALLLSAALTASAQDAVTTFRLFREETSTYLTAKGTSMLEQTPAARGRVILARSARGNTFDPASAKSGDRVIIDVVPGESYVAILDRVAPAGRDYPDLINWSGRLEGFDGSYVLLVLIPTAEGTVGIGGKIFFGGRFVTFEPEGSDNGAVLIREIVSTALEGAPQRQEIKSDAVAPNAKHQPQPESDSATPK